MTEVTQRVTDWESVVRGLNKKCSDEERAKEEYKKKYEDAMEKLAEFEPHPTRRPRDAVIVAVIKLLIKEIRPKGDYQCVDGLERALNCIQPPQEKGDD